MTITSAGRKHTSSMDDKQHSRYDLDMLVESEDTAVAHIFIHAYIMLFYVRKVSLNYHKINN